MVDSYDYGIVLVNYVGAYWDAEGMPFGKVEVDVA